ncbi:ABC transporter substrate-binding protein [Paenibacillus sp. FSL K6-3166]|uniref:ABC transporter substrate-binding protein n=1 Tax=unclassified Paenibacillus TaxID=185978 RepID=UPI000BA18D2C|nr:ABC transporter substrate-binding protein [Paenibacillus sp. VTT E-133291]OZQ89746.1 iron(3+)-hydroxamate-binding protein fhuD [Paenibacillus sp. VTT E-133291]
MFKSPKTYLLLVFTLVITLLLSACGQAVEHTTSVEGTESAASSSNSNDSSSEVDMVTYQASNGDIQVPRNPKRIVDLTSFDTGYFLALGIKPVGVMNGVLNSPYFEGMLEGVQGLGDEPSLEHILELNPDLIVVFSGMEGIEKLAEIAPVVAIQYGAKTIRDQMLDFGTLTGKEVEAKAWVEQWNKKISELKPKVVAAVGDRTVSILNPYSGGLFVFGHSYGRGGEIIYNEFGLKAPPEAQKEAIDSGTGWATISLEKLPQFAGDIVFTCPWAGDTSDPKIVYDNSLWKHLPAVKAGNVFQLDPTADTYNDPVTLEAQLNYITESLLSAK